MNSSIVVAFCCVVVLAIASVHADGRGYGGYENPRGSYGKFGYGFRRSDKGETNKWLNFGFLE